MNTPKSIPTYSNHKKHETNEKPKIQFEIISEARTQERGLHTFVDELLCLQLPLNTTVIAWASADYIVFEKLCRFKLRAEKDEAH